MTDAEILELFRRIRVWNRGDERAPHKALVLLLALAQLQRNGSRWVSFEAVEGPIRELLEEFGPPRQSAHPEYPFWRLRNDGLWSIPEAEDLKQRENTAGDVPVSALRSVHARGGFEPAVHGYLVSRPDLVNSIAADLLERTFPSSLHEAILDAVGFRWVVATRTRRDPRFRDEVLRIYERRCALCGYDGRLGRAELGIDAAHIKWHAAGGPDSPENAVALCSFHHVAFDRGAVSMDDSYHILVSQDVSGQSNVVEMLLRFVGRLMRPPQTGTASPTAEYLAWHREQVFRPPPRN